MKIDRSRVRKSTSDVPIECQQLIERLQACSRTELLEELSKINTWTFGKCELLHWALVLDVFDKILGEAGRKSFENKWALNCDTHYNSTNWGGKENGFGLADCCKADQPMPPSATTLHVEFHREFEDPKDICSKNGKHSPHIIHIEHVDKIHKTPAEIMKSLLGIYYVPPDKQMWLFTHVRLAHHFADYNNRLLCVQARLQALSVLVYSNAIQDSPHNLLYNGLLEELVELVEMKEPHLVEIRSAALRTLTAIIHLDRNPHIPKKPGSRLNNIIDVTGASQYHGFLPLLVRNCIITLTNQGGENQNLKKDDSDVDKSDDIEVESEEGKFVENSDVTMTPQQPLDPNAKFPLSLATALFSFLYHLASYETGGEALVSCGMMESLLQVINWHGVELEHITFVTRAVRVIDLITNIDMQAFQTHGGLQSFINRLDVEVKLCKEEQLYEITSTVSDQTFLDDNAAAGPSTETGHDSIVECTKLIELEYHAENVGKTCLPQRAALLKSMLNFLKKALQDSTFSDNIRHLMEGTLPNSLKNIIANAEYYGPSLFLLATDVVTVYVYQEPSLLSALQDNGLIEVVLHSLLVKEIPATREVLGSLPNVFSALCLNNRGLQSFIKCKPFEKTFSVLLSPDYLPAMRRRRSSEPMADTACNLGNAMDELMRHQPTLKTDAIKAIIDLLEELVNLGTDPKYICWKPHSKSEVSPSSSTRSATNTEGSSDEEDEDEEEASTSSQNAQNDAQVQQENSERTPIALIDYILNTMKFIDAILSNNSTDDHCREFVQQGGLRPLLKILGLPNLPVNCPVTNPAQAVATVCKSILNLAHETNLFKEGLAQLSEVLEVLKPMYTKLDVPSGPKLLLELAGASNVENAFNNASVTPLLHAMGAAHGYIIMLVHVCRTGQSEIRNLSLQNWGSEEGLRVIKGLADLYTSLVWESTLLLAYCSEEYIPSDFTREDIEKLNAFFDKVCRVLRLPHTYNQRLVLQCESSNTGSDSTVNVASAMEALTTNPPTISMDVDQEAVTLNLSTSLKYIKPLLGASSRLGRALAELFGLLVKLCVGSPIRQRRGQNIIAAPPLPTPYARSVATALNVLLADGLDYERLPACPLLKSRITFLICSVGFTSPMLFDEKRYPYHLMLKKFVALGGQATFFNTFRWALSAGGTIPIEKAFEQGALPEGTAGFLDAWLMLLEKMVNPKAILESPHIISNRSTQSSTYRGYSFDPLKYLIQIHKLAFEAVMLLWDKAPIASYGTRLSENILTILRHILRGEKIIKEKLKAEENMTTDLSRPKATSSSNSNREPEVNPESLSQLMDMGFSREHVTDALLNTLTVEQATDYLLTNPPSLYRISQSFMNSDSFEDDQVMQAIAISLGVSNNSPSVSKKKQIQDDGKPLSESLIDEFTNHALEACLKLLDATPESVHKICELLVTIMKRNGRTFRDNLLDTLVKEIYDSAETVWLYYLDQDNDPDYQNIMDLPCTSRLGNYIHLYILFFEVSSYFEMKIPCALAVHKTGLVNLLIKLICMVEKVMNRSENFNEPKWLASSFLLIDAVSKVSTCTHRKRNMHLSTTRVWRWFQLETGKWTPYSNSNNKLINDAYWNGEQSVRVTCGRRRYTVTFSNMLQLNDESGNNRPICMTLINSGLPSCSDVSVVNSEESLEAELTEKEEKRCTLVPNLDKTQETEIVRACVKFMHMPIDKDLLHSILQICIRLTRNFDLAKIFVQEGGVKCLLKMKQVREFAGFGILATILIRHALEEPNTLSYAIEKIIRARTLSTIPPYYKELLYLTRQIGGAVTRSPETFFEVAKNILRIDTEVNREDIDLGIPVKTEPPTRTRAPPLEEVVSNEVICDLLNALLKPLEFADETQSQSSPQNTTQNPSKSTTDNLSGDIDDSGPGTPASRTQTDANSENRSDSEQKKKKMMLPKSVILKILGDAVVSYGPVARIITEYTYKAGSADCLKEDCTALAFILDKILPETENISDSDCSTMCRMLIAAIASSNHSPEAQFTLVSEVRAALLRALMMPESTEKHSQVQLIAGIISIMIDNCPSSQARVKSQPPTPQMNNIVRLMIRKSLFNDLARVPHYLDLSSPNTPFTVNACLKSLEALSRIVNQPVPANVQKSKKNQQPTDESAGTQSGTSTEGTNAQREVVIDDSVVIEDSENTEHDIAVVTSTIEVEANENENVLVHMIDQLLEQGNDNNQSFSDVASSRNHTMDIDEDGNLTYEHERDATEELMSTDSGESDSNPSDQVEDEENDDNEGDDENIDDADDTNYDDEDGSDRRRASYMDRNDDVLMIQYTNPGAENEVVTRMVAYPMGDHAAFPMPLFDEINNSSDHTGPIVHPLLLSRNTTESSSSTVTRTQRVTRARRYQYLFNPRNPNPPVILQRLLGPHEPQVTLASANSILGGPPEMRESARLVVMDNFGLLPSHEEQIDFVDQSGYLFGPSLAATLNHISPVLHWWNIESKCLDYESVYDSTTEVCNKLIPILIKHRNVEMVDKKKSDAETLRRRFMDNTFAEDCGINYKYIKPVDDSTEPNATDVEQNKFAEIHDLFQGIVEQSDQENNEENSSRDNEDVFYCSRNRASCGSVGDIFEETLNQQINSLSNAERDPIPTEDSVTANSMQEPEEILGPSLMSTPQTPANSEPGPSSDQVEEIPDGVDPSFLEALPPDMRQEVLEQHRILRLQQRIASRILLFTDDPHLGKLRLHRVIRNLCYHAPTREWIVNALLSIIDKSVHVKPDENLNKPVRKMPKPGPLSSKLMTDSKLLQNNGNWLNIRMEAALGCSANVFIVNRTSTGKRSDRSSSASISIHPQAAPIVCRNALDLFTSLAKAFPSCLLPIKCIRDDREDKNNLSPVRVKTDGSCDFWDILLKLDSVSTKKGKSIPKSSNSNSSAESDNKVVSFEQSVFGQLLNMLSSPVVNRNTQLTDNLLRLLSVITSGMPELAKPNVPIKSSKSKHQKMENLTPTHALHLAVNVITYKNCSEEGLEFITNLLLNLASSTLEMSYMILNLLLTGAVRIGEIVREQIQDMLKELKELNNAQKRKQNVKRSDASWFYDIPALSDQLSSIDSLWETLSQCLSELEHTPDHHAVLVLQPAVEAFFLVHSPQQGPSKKDQQDTEQNASQSTEGQASSESSEHPTQASDVKFVNAEIELNTAETNTKAAVPPEQQKFLSFAEKHRRVLNQILRQSTSHLADGPFAVLVDHTRILDFDIKRRYFRSELERMDQGIRREETAVHVRRSHIFEDSFRELYRRSPEEWKNRFYIVFEDEEGQDAGGLLREWYVIISRDIFNPMYALFTVSPGDRVTYMINSASHYNPNHLCYYKFVGRVIAKAIYDNKLLECYFTRSFYKHILGIPVKYTDMESEDYSFYRGLVYLMENNINNLGLDLTFSTEINEFGVTETRDLIINGRHVPVTEETKMEYIRLSCQMKMTGAIKQQ
ncbi:DUF913, HECT, DUF908 and/or WWE domain containing protein [Asbolus verrucosus]|uniref:HECT-type E3 ubiquitin transferase n=1 Tax=Asbolus verrucosus TaxID=1661398 RepID=A0A482V8N4_ASBVE|nr:DUF913, HECT, DUF908 and/or WWE domain containing protein [Asbolus verrucosus]